MLWRSTCGWRFADGTGDEVEADYEAKSLDEAIEGLPTEDLPDLADRADEVVALTMHLQRVDE